jgi:hypothetical protein
MELLHFLKGRTMPSFLMHSYRRNVRREKKRHQFLLVHTTLVGKMKSKGREKRIAALKLKNNSQ